MWLAEATDQVTAGANLWYVVGLLITTFGGSGIAWLSRRKVKTIKSETAAAIDDGVAEYRRLFTDPLTEERDDYRARWIKCEEDRRA